MPANANRVCFIPGEFDGDLKLKPRDYGVLSRETRNATSVVNPRELIHWQRPFTMSIWSAPLPGETENEQASLGLVEDLLEQVVRALQNVTAPDGTNASACISWGKAVVASPPNENSFGVELLVTGYLKGPLFDVTLDYVQPSPAFEGQYLPPIPGPNPPIPGPILSSGFIMYIPLMVGVSTVISPGSLPAGAMVTRCVVEVLTPYSPGATIEVGQMGVLGAFQTTVDNFPQTVDVYDAPQYTMVSSNPIVVTINGSPSEGSALIMVEYAAPFI
jgi:hypothetical protein